MGNSIVTPTRLKFVIINDKIQANILLDKAEREDFYIEECHDDRANSLSRKDITYTPNAISVRDYNYAITYLESIYNSIPIRLLSDLEEVNIIQLMPTADGGMPHTRPGNIICYPDISQLFSISTLIHELWHIHQRSFKDMWYKTFKRIGWLPWNGQLPEHLEKARRYNPDTIDSPFWIFDEQWVPIPIFKDISKPKVNEVEIWFYNIHKQYHITRIPESMHAYYSNLPPTAYEHPREITAYMLSEYDKYKSSQAFKHLIESIGEISIITSNKSN